MRVELRIFRASLQPCMKSSRNRTNGFIYMQLCSHRYLCLRFHKSYTAAVSRPAINVSSQGRRSRSNVNRILSLLGFTITHSLFVSCYISFSSVVVSFCADRQIYMRCACLLTSVCKVGRLSTSISRLCVDFLRLGSFQTLFG